MFTNIMACGAPRPWHVPFDNTAFRDNDSIIGSKP